MCRHIFGVYKYHASTSKCEMMANFEEEKKGNVRKLFLRKETKKWNFPWHENLIFLKTFCKRNFYPKAILPSHRIYIIGINKLQKTLLKDSKQIFPSNFFNKPYHLIVNKMTMLWLKMCSISLNCLAEQRGNRLL